MKRLIPAVMAAFILTGCGTEKRLPSVKQSTAELESSPTSASTSAISEESRVIYRERLCNSSSYTKSDLIIESDGRVWCGFYMHNEGNIDRYNRLNINADEYSSDYQLDDDRWLMSYISESEDDDFMLFGDVFELGKLNADELAELRHSISSADLSAENRELSDSDEASADETENGYIFIDLVIGREIHRIYVNTGGYESRSQDENSLAAIEQVHSCPFYDEWREKCREMLVPYTT